MKTTGRSLAIIRQLTEHEGPMTTSMIADRLEVSSKTILRSYPMSNGSWHYTI